MENYIVEIKSMKQNIKPAVYGAVIGAIAVMIVGFNFVGWVTDKTAKDMISAGIVESMIPICVGQFNSDADKVTKLAVMKGTDSWKRPEYLTDQGWATMPGAAEADSTVARGCVDKILS
jgi:hypothetical protein